ARQLRKHDRVVAIRSQRDGLQYPDTCEAERFEQQDEGQREGVEVAQAIPRREDLADTRSEEIERHRGHGEQYDPADRQMERAVFGPLGGFVLVLDQGVVWRRDATPG